MCVLAYGDAALKNMAEGKTQGGSIVVLANLPSTLNKDNKNIKCCLIAWTSGRIKRVVLNTYGGELLQQVATFDHGSWLAALYHEFRPDLKKVDLHLKCDALSVVENITLSLRQQVREKRLTADLWALREAIANGDITSMTHTPTGFMIADGLTKTKDSKQMLIAAVMQGRIQMYDGPPHSSIQDKDAAHVPRRPAQQQEKEQEKVRDVKRTITLKSAPAEVDF